MCVTMVRNVPTSCNSSHTLTPWRQCALEEEDQEEYGVMEEEEEEWVEGR